MPDINIKITVDDSELIKKVASSNKLLGKMEKAHSSAVKKRTKVEADSYDKVNKIAKEQLKAQEKLNKALEQANKKRLDNEVKAEKEAIRKKQAARARMKSFALQAGAQGLGALGLGQLGAGVGLIGTGGLLGAGIGVGIAAISALAKFASGMMKFQDSMVRFGIATRLTRGEVKGLSTELGVIGAGRGVNRSSMLEALQGIFDTTRRVPALDQLGGIANAMKVTGETGKQFAASIAAIGKNLDTTDFDKIFKVYQIFAASGDMNSAIKTLESMPASLKKTEKNMISLANIVQLKPVKSLEDLQKLTTELANAKVFLFKGDPKGGNLNDFDKILKQIVNTIEDYKRRGKELPDILKNFDVNRIYNIRTTADAMQYLKDAMATLDETSPTTAFDKLKNLLELLVSEATMPMLQKGAEALSKFVGDPEKVRKMTDALGDMVEVLKPLAWYFKVLAKRQKEFFEAVDIYTTPPDVKLEPRKDLDPDDPVNDMIRAHNKHLADRKSKEDRYISWVKDLEKQGISPIGRVMTKAVEPINIDQKIYLDTASQTAVTETSVNRGEKVKTTTTLMDLINAAPIE